MEIKSEQLWSLVKPRLRTYLGHTWDFGLVATVTGSTVPTVTGWLADQTPPGERLIRLWHLLAALGLESPELADLPSYNRYCGELLTFGVVDIKELQQICNLANTQGVLSVLRGTPPMRAQFNVVELRELHDEALQARRAELTPVNLSPSDRDRDNTVHEEVRFDGDDLIVFTASKLSSVLPLLRHLESEQATAEERSTLRMLVGNDDMFDLSNILNRLCSERARTHGRTGK